MVGGRFLSSVLFAATSFFVAVPTVAAEPAITEFMAVNDTTLVDSGGDASDWIEVHNPGPGSVLLGGWHLTDNAAILTKWSFPDRELAAGDYLVVFASGKDRVDGELHTSFKLIRLSAADSISRSRS